ncbi:nucleoside-diphosphate sugar epimerase/dehydratase [Halobacteriovorax sp. GB3]|uniref:polysaccharide biosynthesis protein n=1 Tax=Halobacteriovorax sp. GB3 TaxID=2719615 RepID=UPI00236313D6|nr:nucleoside-diphosphate sugar epimerase/dehydratase [Halobacteriovorax sp. GB3]MDD0852503.1 nucleoside-diphosphate sugar epimerase/dehydratase [Halobacteriovorax sp. GB3]
MSIFNWISKPFVLLDKRQKVGIILDYFLLFIALFITQFYLNQELPSKTTLFIFPLIKILILMFFSVHRSIWKFFSIRDFTTLLKALTLVNVLLYIGSGLFFDQKELLKVTFNLLIDLNILVGARLFFRLKFSYYNKRETTPAILIGAGQAGEQILRELIGSPKGSQYQIAGIFDDNIKYISRTIHGISILGSTHDIPNFIKNSNIKMAIIAIPSASSSEKRRILKICEEANLEIKTLPGTDELLSDKVSISLLRNVTPEDLLERALINISHENIISQHKDKTILVTGAGGSIGSELCRQILSLKPKRLVILDSSEFFLYSIEKKLKSEFPGVDLIPVIGDVRNIEKVNLTIETYKPEIIYHAAAYKHVPIMEAYPVEAIQTNVQGTINMANAAEKYGVPNFVLISTDKAVNPTNVMGATKRMAEIFCQYKNLSSTTRYKCVRFGNVLGSNGSVVPLFKEQIKNGGPITVTHPEITRYFMTIPEACQLVLQTNSMSEDGDIFVLDMGSPVKIVDLAKNLIKLSGLEVDKDIKIEYTGLRPGEKLYEELLADKESTIQTKHPRVRAAIARKPSDETIDKIFNLLNSSHSLSVPDIKNKIKEVVSEYTFE